MLLSPDIMRWFMVICLFGMAVLAALFLRRRRLSFMAYMGWGLLIVMLPYLGPFLVLMMQPGSKANT